MKKGDIVKGKDLQPGMAVRRVKFKLTKLVVAAHLEGKGIVCDGEPIIEFFDLDDPYYGPCYTTLDPEDDFEIFIEPNTEEYEKMVKMIRDELSDNIKGIFKAIDELDNLTEEYVKRT